MLKTEVEDRKGKRGGSHLQSSSFLCADCYSKLRVRLYSLDPTSSVIHCSLWLAPDWLLSSQFMWCFSPDRAVNPPPVLCVLLFVCLCCPENLCVDFHTSCSAFGTVGHFRCLGFTIVSLSVGTICLLPVVHVAPPCHPSLPPCWISCLPRPCFGLPHSVLLIHQEFPEKAHLGGIFKCKF